ncbi:hypothetical protein EVAR_93393_1 [Eumeta japonica]|uniref:Uncharacterized protein n=1 Tax=Eumeta variegata TaxID=151549 RepID=A0A4C1UR40_EUMVA|nr:hypothetical protein EVAR_93393_1 [Eumeta japonica]
MEQKPVTEYGTAIKTECGTGIRIKSVTGIDMSSSGITIGSLTGIEIDKNTGQPFSPSQRRSPCARSDASERGTRLRHDGAPTRK